MVPKDGHQVMFNSTLFVCFVLVFFFVSIMYCLSGRRVFIRGHLIHGKMRYFTDSF